MKTQPEFRLENLLETGKTVLSDGATGTFLQYNGLEPGGCPEEFNISHPDIVKRMSKEYFEAGSDIVLTNSFGGNKFMLQKYGYGDRVDEFNRLAAKHATANRPEGKFVLGSVGPTGEFVAPLGAVSSEEMSESFSEQIAGLVAGGVDGVTIETMTALEEAKLAISEARKHPGLTVMTTMTFDKGPRGLFTMMGVTPERAVKELIDAGSHVVGSNCGNGIEVMTEVARKMRQATTAPILIHSNAGIPTIRKGHILYPETPEFMANYFLELADLGINFIGGCCGTTPKHIKAINSKLRSTQGTPFRTGVRS